MKTIFAAIAIAAGVAIIEVSDDDRREPLPAVVVVGSAHCGPCRVLHTAWNEAIPPASSGHAWRRWILENYEIEFVAWKSLPATDRDAVKTVPAVFIHPGRRGRDRDGPLELPIADKQHAVTALGSLLFRKHYLKNAD